MKEKYWILDYFFLEIPTGASKYIRRKDPNVHAWWTPGNSANLYISVILTCGISEVYTLAVKKISSIHNPSTDIGRNGFYKAEIEKGGLFSGILLLKSLHTLLEGGLGEA